MSNSKSDTFGINIRAWCKEHEKYIEDHKDNMNPNKLLRRHEEKLRFLQHERLVHLIVTVMCVGIELFAIGLMFFFHMGMPMQLHLRFYFLYWSDSICDIISFWKIQYSTGTGFRMNYIR